MCASLLGCRPCEALCQVRILQASSLLEKLKRRLGQIFLQWLQRGRRGSLILRIAQFRFQIMANEATLMIRLMHIDIFLFLFFSPRFSLSPAASRKKHDAQNLPPCGSSVMHKNSKNLPRWQIFPLQSPPQISKSRQNRGKIETQAISYPKIARKVAEKQVPQHISSPKILKTVEKSLPSWCRTRIDMKKYKVKEVIKMLEDDGWINMYTKGDHRQFKHPTKKGKVTVRGKPSETLEQFLLNSIWKQAGWR